MNGAHKLTRKDKDRILELVRQGNSDSKISREFRSENGHQISRVHIGSIRRRQRWNDDTRSYLMKEDLTDLPQLVTQYDDHQKTVCINTQVGKVFIPNPESNFGLEEKYIILHYKDDQIIQDRLLDISDEIPSREELMEIHRVIIGEYV